MFKEVINDIELSFETSDKVFSPSSIDKGTLGMLSKVDFNKIAKMLDLGCGYGVVGILMAKKIGPENVVMCDISDDALELAKLNAINNGVPDIKIIKSNGLEQIEDDGFDLILSNPPYHTDFSVPKRFIEDGYKKLALGGKMIMVTKRLEWYKNKLKTIFGGVQVFEIDGYYIFISEKRNTTIKKKTKQNQTMSKKLQRKYRVKHD